ncbi:aromatic amino acid lyase [Streptomyces sp. NPDC096132]|uniref:aromatic amino acid lyase n=1 Tax=Streptomyces sp. NPDC096132 TaxID=3366075 RepID=UPI00381EF512
MDRTTDGPARVSPQQRDSRVVLTGTTLTVDELIALADGEAVPAVAPEARERAVRSWQTAERLAAAGRLYGRGTGVGAHRSVPVDEGDETAHSLRLLRSHAGGAGALLPARQVRAMLAVRANQLLAGGSGIQPAFVDALTEALRLGVHPAVNEYGGIGTGDLTALAQTGLTLIGERPWVSGELPDRAEGAIDAPAYGATDGGDLFDSAGRAWRIADRDGPEKSAGTDGGMVGWPNTSWRDDRPDPTPPTTAQPTTAPPTPAALTEPAGPTAPAGLTGPAAPTAPASGAAPAGSAAPTASTALTASAGLTGSAAPTAPAALTASAGPTGSAAPTAPAALTASAGVTGSAVPTASTALTASAAPTGSAVPTAPAALTESTAAGPPAVPASWALHTVAAQPGVPPASAVPAGPGFLPAPVTLRAGDALALLSSNALALGQAALAQHGLDVLLRATHAVAALSLAAVSGSAEAYAAPVHALRPYPGAARAAGEVRRLLGIDDRASGAPGRRIQDPFGFRAFPQAHGCALDASERLRTVVEVEVNCPSENPLVTPDGTAAYHHGGFFAAPLGLALDAACLALLQTAQLSVARLAALGDPALTGLPGFLAAGPASSSGTMILEYTANSALAELRSCTAPASAGHAVLSRGLEEAASFAGQAARQALRATDAYVTVLACELVSAVRALRLRPVPPQVTAFTVATAALPLGTDDRPLTGDLTAAAELLPRLAEL